MIITDLSEDALSVTYSRSDRSIAAPIDISNPLYISKRMAISNGQVVACGLVKITCEGILIIDNSAPLISRVNAIKELIDIQSKECKNKGLTECHMFTKRHKMQLFLSKLGFTTLYNEIPMMINL